MVFVVELSLPFVGVFAGDCTSLLPEWLLLFVLRTDSLVIAD